MFEFLFKYPFSVFAKGTFVLLGSWPRWLLWMGVFAVGSALGAFLFSRRELFIPSLRGRRGVILWLLQSTLLATLLLLLWQPAISITALKPQENIVAVVVDDSRSMAVEENGRSRTQQAQKILTDGLLKSLRARFQVRLYRLGAGVERVTETSQLTASQASTQIGKGLRQLADEAATLPLGAVVLLSDGADNSGGIDLNTLSELRRRRLPVNAVGFGNQEISNDVELDGVDVPAKALEGSRLQARVTIRQNGFSGKRSRLSLSAGGEVLASREVELKSSPEQVETLEFGAGKRGVMNLAARIEPLPGEKNALNNQLTRVLAVDNTKHRILYVEGEPRWDYKFIRRALDDDPAIEIVSMLRTTQNKIYRQGIANPNELINGFPEKPEELFEYQGLILGSVEESFFSMAQRQMIEAFANRRGGGVLLLGGRYALADGGYNVSPFSQLLPVTLPSRKNTFQRSFVAAELTDAGRSSLICRIEDDAEKSNQHWEVLPYLANYQDPGIPKPGAVVLAKVDAGGTRLPLLITQNYGRGRTAVFATGGSWRWRMQQPLGDNSQETFWRQMLRWVAGSSPTRVVASLPDSHIEDDGKIQLRGEVRDEQYQPAADAAVQASIIQPDGTSQVIALRPDPLAAGVYAAEWNAPKPGSYIAEVTARQGGKPLGKDVLTFRREDGVAENFHREQNRELLQKLAEETGGRYYTPQTVNRLSREIAYSEAGITSREIKDLWDMPIVFLLVIALRASEWLLRRRWGVV
jgi:uncharacterized membrane protein